MSTYPLAYSFYSPNYSATVEQKSLQALQNENFRTHTSLCAERLHRFSETIMLPGRWNAQLLGRVIEPFPGENKEWRFLGLVIRVGAFVLWLLTLPIAIGSFLLAFPFRMIDHRYRPLMSFMKNSGSTGAKGKSLDQLTLTQANPLHIRTHNLGLVTSSMSSVGDLRSPVVRAKEVVKSIMGDPCKPDLIFFQEAFHEDATRILCEGLKEYEIVHNIAPQISGFPSGAMVASKYPIESVTFHRINHMLGPERLTPRGILRVRLKSSVGPVLVYAIHIQALPGEGRSKARFHQLEEINNFMKADLEKEPQAMQVLVGDFNTSRVSVWGKDHLNPKGQAEEKVLQRLDEHFDDLYLRDHHPLLGERTKDKPVYLHHDNARMQENLTEPTGTWYWGPFADFGIFLGWKIRLDRYRNNRPAPGDIPEISLPKNTWGTRAWHKEQPAKTARMDFIFVPKQQGKSKLDGRAEIRRIVVPKGAQSASSDHLPVDARIWIKRRLFFI